MHNKILQLVNSDQQEKSISRKLIKWHLKDPTLFNLTFECKRSLFYVLVRKNKVVVIEELLKIDKFITLAMKADRNHDSILHYSIRKPKNNRLSFLFIDRLPDLLNLRNSLGNTPLHEAVINGNIEVIYTLAKHPNIKIQMNYMLKTPFDLIYHNDEKVKHALCSEEINRIMALDLSHTLLSDLSRGVGKSFPGLTSHNPSSCHLTSEKATTHLELSNAPLTTSSKGKETKHKSSFSKKKNKKKLSEIFEQLVMAYEQNRYSLEYQELKNQFCMLCLKTRSVNVQNLYNSIRSASNNKAILRDILNQLYPIMHGKLAKNLEKKMKVKEAILVLIISEIHKSSFQSNSIDFTPIKEMNQDLLEIIRLILTPQEMAYGVHQYDLIKISHQVIGLQSKIPFEEFIICLRNLYQSLNVNQKFVANYIVFQLLSYYAVSNKYQPNANLDSELKLFFKCNTDKKFGLGLVGENLNKLIDQFIHYHNYHWIKNYCHLDCYYAEINYHSGTESFDQLVEHALAKKASARKQEIEIIAHELKMLTIEFYKTVPLSEFHNGSRSSKKEEHLTPAITKFAGYFNRLNNYFLTKIITQPPGNIVNAIQFLIQLAKSVCSLDTNNLPDLNSLMLISSILNGSIMNRLSNYFSMLTEQEKDTIREINDIIAPDKNYKTMRSILSRREALPFLGLILSDLTFAMENETQLFQIETVGETLTKLAQIKLLVNFEVVQYQTNLLQFLDNYQPSDEDMLYYKSLRLQPRKSDILSLDDFLEDPAKVFTTLDEQYFNNNLIPNIVYRGELHPISQCGIQLTAWFYDKLCSFDHKTRDINALESLLKSLENALKSFIKIYNQFYYPIYQSEQINQYYILLKLSQLKAEFEKISSIDPRTCQNLTRPKIKRWFMSKEASIPSQIQDDPDRLNGHQEADEGIKMHGGSTILSPKNKSSRVRFYSSPAIDAEKPAMRFFSSLSTDPIPSKNSPIIPSRAQRFSLPVELSDSNQTNDNSVNLKESDELAKSTETVGRSKISPRRKKSLSYGFYSNPVQSKVTDSTKDLNVNNPSNTPKVFLHSS
ncbi:TPA: RasGEF domain-containing protein [Legionella pneumophila]|uniref:RasGEF domain-containing protein n=1 Tax=Legionella pneumophila TaxID=446 RepID=UPI001C165AC1|nr:hypothetical protein [Legionella pneumophila]